MLTTPPTIRNRHLVRYLVPLFAMLVFTAVLVSAADDSMVGWHLAWLVVGVVVYSFLAFWTWAGIVNSWMARAYQHALVKDPWLLQRQIMESSGQRLPSVPSLTKESVLYIALTAEELGEVAAVAAEVLHDGVLERDTGDLASKLRLAAVVLQDMSHDLRAQIATRDFAFPMTPQQSVDLLDGVTDCAVTVCGLCEASGLPGMPGYLEVYRSNRSKANPDTGRVDKTPDGKWIKGVNYTPPDLHAVMRAQDCGTDRGTV